MSDTMNTTLGPRPTDTAARPDPIHELITRLNREAPTIATKDPDLSRTIQQIADATEKRPDRVNDEAFRSRVAYALQDMEKLAGPIASVPEGLREEMNRLAVAAPGLQNERLQEMMRATPAIDDTRLVRDIRALATNVGASGGDQNTPSVHDRVEALENRVRMATPVSPAADTAGPRTPGPDDRQAQPGQAAQDPAGTGRAQGAQATRADIPKWEDPAGAAGQAKSAEAANPPPQGQVSVSARGPGVVGEALAALARAARADSPDMDRQPTSVVDRSARHEDAFQQRRDEATIQGAEKSQRAALDALRDFSNGPGSNILTKIQDAARSEPGGMQAVLSEMRDGGRFAGLRQQFNADLVMERGAAAAWDRMASSLQQYGEDLRMHGLARKEAGLEHRVEQQLHHRLMGSRPHGPVRGRSLRAPRPPSPPR